MATIMAANGALNRPDYSPELSPNDPEPPPPPPEVLAHFAACGRYGAALRQRVIVVCEACGAEAEKLPFAKYCSDGCRAAMKRRRGVSRAVDGGLRTSTDHAPAVIG